MNLHAIVAPVIAAVNPRVAGTLQASNGYTTTAAGKRVPAYDQAFPIQAQVQSLTYKDLMQLDGLNLNGEKRAIYLTGDIQGVLRPESKGGDLITLENGTRWLVAQVLENWSMNDGWVKVAVTRQM